VIRVDVPPAGDGSQPDLGGDHFEEVAQTLRAVARADQRDSEQVVLREAWRDRSYADVFEEAMRRGDRVALHLQGGQALQGVLIDSGRDFVTLAPEHADAAPFDVQLAVGSSGAGLVALEILERGASRGTRGTGDAFVTFAARLNEYAYLTEDLPTRRVVVAHRAAESGWGFVRGELRAFAWDHLYLAATSGDVFLPLGMVAYIRWAGRPPSHYPS
jgi:hypothetical protein